jgi:hypothetical protein
VEVEVEFTVDLLGQQVVPVRLEAEMVELLTELTSYKPTLLLQLQTLVPEEEHKEVLLQLLEMVALEL